MPQIIMKHIVDRNYGETMEIYVDDILVRKLHKEFDEDATEAFEFKRNVIFDFITALENQGFEIVRDGHYKT